MSIRKSLSVFELHRLFEAPQPPISDEEDDGDDGEVDVSQVVDDDEEVDVPESGVTRLMSMLDAVIEGIMRAPEMRPSEYADVVAGLERSVAEAEEWIIAWPTLVRLPWGVRQQLLEIEMPALRANIAACASAVPGELEAVASEARARALSITAMLRQ